jgi:F0F1-type ATP synthase epsilon subunit
MDATTLNLEIVSPTIAQQLTVEWIEVESPTGSFFVGPNHNPLISIIKNKSYLQYKPLDSEPTSVVTTHGVFYVEHNKAVAILD